MKVRGQMNLLIELDKAGAEWVVVAYLANDGAMIQVVESGASPHVATGVLLSHSDGDFVTKENKIVGNMTDPLKINEVREDLTTEEGWWLPRSMSIRQAGKKANHGLNYDMKYKRAALEWEIQENEARDIVERYHSAYPGIRQWHKHTQDQLRKNRMLTNCFGRQRRFMDGWGQTLFDAAYSFVPQSTVFDITREGMTKWYDDPSMIGNTELLAQTHDSCTFQFNDINSGKDLAPKAVKIGLDYMNPMLNYNGRDFKIGTTMKIGLDWGGSGMHEVLLSDDVDATALAVDEVLETIRGKKKA
jgi:hypothetical protein